MNVIHNYEHMNDCSYVLPSQIVGNRLAFLLAKRNTVLRYARSGRFQVGGGDIYQHKPHFISTHLSQLTQSRNPLHPNPSRYFTPPFHAHQIPQLKTDFPFLTVTPLTPESRNTSSNFHPRTKPKLTKSNPQISQHWVYVAILFRKRYKNIDAVIKIFNNTSHEKPYNNHRNSHENMYKTRKNCTKI